MLALDQSVLPTCLMTSSYHSQHTVPMCLSMIKFSTSAASQYWHSSADDIVTFSPSSKKGAILSTNGLPLAVTVIKTIISQTVLLYVQCLTVR